MGLAYSNQIMVTLRAGSTRNKEGPHEALANLRDDPQASWVFFDRWGGLYQESLSTTDQASAMRATGLRCPNVNIELRDHLRKAWDGDKGSLDFIERSAGQYMRFSWGFKGARAELVAEDLWAAICVFFLRDRAALRIARCENPNCSAPYFIRKRSTQKFCEAGPCVEHGARLRANKWWQKHGDEWRKKSAKGGK